MQDDALLDIRVSWDARRVQRRSSRRAAKITQLFLLFVRVSFLDARCS